MEENYSIQGWYTLNGRLEPSQVEMHFGIVEPSRSPYDGSVMLGWEDFLKFVEMVTEFKAKEERRMASEELRKICPFPPDCTASDCPHPETAMGNPVSPIPQTSLPVEPERPKFSRAPVYASIAQLFFSVLCVGFFGFAAAFEIEHQRPWRQTMTLACIWVLTSLLSAWTLKNRINASKRLDTILAKVPQADGRIVTGRYELKPTIGARMKGMIQWTNGK